MTNWIQFQASNSAITVSSYSLNLFYLIYKESYLGYLKSGKFNIIVFPAVTKVYDVVEIFIIYLFHFVFLFSLQPVVDAFDPRLLISPPMCHPMDFTKIKVGINYLFDILFLRSCLFDEFPLFHKTSWSVLISFSCLYSI